MTEAGDTLRRIEGVVDDLRELLGDTRDRVIRMESAELAAKVSRCESRIDAVERDIRQLENAENRRIGARGMFEWLAKYGPSLAAIAAALGWLTIVAKGVSVK